MNTEMLSRVRAMLLRRQARELTTGPDLAALLGRRAVNLDTPELQRFLAGRRVMITGAGGSIGSELCRQAARFCPERLILVERAEGSLFEIDRELRERWIGVDVRPCLADVTDATRVERVFAEHRPHVVFHAAAHKHVPMMELNPGEAIKNNIFGTRVVARTAASHGVASFVLISTDKAVNPTSVMGATKRIAEMVVQREQSRELRAESREKTRLQLLTLNSQLSTQFSAVRFGNVLGSSGSVVPIFERQIAAGGPVTVTHAEMTRFFMTIPEATQLVMQAGAMGTGGEVFVLDMGEPMRILDLARRMIAHAGLTEGKDIELRFTGLRPGEKLFEELSRDDEPMQATRHAKIRVLGLPSRDDGRVEAMLTTLADVIDAPPGDIICTLTEVLDEYQPTVRPRRRGETMATELAA